MPSELGGTQLEMGVFGKQPGPDPAPSPGLLPLDSLVSLDHARSAFLPSPARSEAGSAL